MTTLPLRPPGGRLLTAEKVAAELFGGGVSTSWVRRNVPHRVKFGDTKQAPVLWYEADVRAWVEKYRT
ncbi:MAG: hypothetical protein IH965_09695 [Gemmatimonadetes bacterium]|nr:hypothetical protein [Gemmatimonadota bacterium]